MSSRESSFDEQPERPKRPSLNSALNSSRSSSLPPRRSHSSPRARPPGPSSRKVPTSRFVEGNAKRELPSLVPISRSGFPSEEANPLENASFTTSSVDGLTLQESFRQRERRKTRNSVPRLSAQLSASSIVALQTGDMIYLQKDDVNGVVFGDMNLRQIGLETNWQLEGINKAPFGSWNFQNCVFRVCTKFNYRSKTELSSLERELGLSGSNAREAKELKLARERAKIEREQNSRLMEDLRRGGGKFLKYGDIVQLEHLPSGLFVTAHEGAARVDPHCRHVSLEGDGSYAAHFRILPRYKMRTVGSPVIVDDGVILQSVPFDSITLGTAVLPGVTEHLAVRQETNSAPLPRYLLHGPTYEVNGSMEDRGGFSVKLFSRPSDVDTTLSTTLVKFRFYHPESDSFIQASSNVDKGASVDFVEGHRKVFRRDHIPAHVPYLKKKTDGQPSAKGVWSFESVEKAQAGPVKWGVPLRIRHVSSGAYLSVDSLNPTFLYSPDEDMDVDTSLFNVALVSDVDPKAKEGSFGSAASLEFMLVTHEVEPTATLSLGVTTMTLEHRPPEGLDAPRRLYLLSPNETKPDLLDSAEGGGGESLPKEAKGIRLLFSSTYFPDDALRIIPITREDSMRIDRVVGMIPLLKLYTHLFVNATNANDHARCVSLVEPLVGSCVQFVEDLGKSSTGTERPKQAIKTLELIKLANSRSPIDFFGHFAGEVVGTLQTLACDLKLTDALLGCALAAYDRVRWSRRPFEQGAANNGAPRALQKFLYMTLDKILTENTQAQIHFSKGSSPVSLDPSKLEDWKAIDLNKRHIFEWSSLLIMQSEDAFGAAVLLTRLIKSGHVFQSGDSRKFIPFVRDLIKKTGPDRRLLGLLRSLCFLEGSPSRTHQEAMVRDIWKIPKERNQFAVLLHEHELLEEENFRGRRQRYDPKDMPPNKAPFLGEAPNSYSPVCVSWSSNDDWSGGCGSLWWSPHKLAIDTIPGSDALVRIETFLWPLEPDHLYAKVVGGNLNESLPWLAGHAEGKAHRPSESVKSRVRQRTLTQADHQFSEQFEKHKQIAEYVVDQFLLLADICEGRSAVPIDHFTNMDDKQTRHVFSFELLMNMASNELLPRKFRAAVLKLMEVLYLDRFPQLHASGCPFLPETLWVVGSKGTEKRFPFHEEPELPSKIYKQDSVSVQYGHFKFFLLRALCAELISQTAADGIIHAESDELFLVRASLESTLSLLDFGFCGSLPKLKDLNKVCSRLLDGRSERKSKESPFEDASERYKLVNGQTTLAVQIKRLAIGLLLGISDLRTNYRLSVLLDNLGEKLKNTQNAKNLDYITGATDKAAKEFYGDFERLFPPRIPRSPNSSDSKKLKNLIPSRDSWSWVKNIDESIIDCLMHDDDDLLSSSMRLLFSTYGQRLHLKESLMGMEMLESEALPVFGDVTKLKAEMSELDFLLSTSSVWGVSSVISGPFDDERFSRAVQICDRLLLFLHQGGEDDKERLSQFGLTDDDGYGNSRSRPSVRGRGSSPMRGPGGARRPLSKASSITEGKREGNMKEILDEPISLQHQVVLRSLNFQRLLSQQALGKGRIDPALSHKGSICTEEQKIESERRLSLVHCCLLRLAISFVKGSRHNQTLLAPVFPKIVEIAHDSSDPRGGAAAAVAMSKTSSKAQQSPPTTEQPMLLREVKRVASLAEDLLLVILRQNEAMVMKHVDVPLILFFAQVVDASKDVSTCVALDFFTNIMKPEGRPLRKLQAEVVDVLMDPVFANLKRALKSCLEGLVSNLRIAASAARGGVQDKIDDSEDDEEVDFDSAQSQYKMKYPIAVLKLAHSLLEGGSSASWQALISKGGFSIEVILSTLLKFVRTSLWGQAPGQQSAKGGGQRRDSKAVPKLILSTTGRALNQLITEAVVMLPLTTKVLRSEVLWGYIETIALPVIARFDDLNSKEDGSVVIAEECLDCLEHIFSELFTAGLLEDVSSHEHTHRTEVFAKVAASCHKILKNKDDHPEFLRDAFDQAVEKHGGVVQALSKAEFIDLIRYIEAQLRTEDGVQPTQLQSVWWFSKNISRSEATLSEAFDLADEDGNATIDFEEFTHLFDVISKKRAAETGVKPSASRRITECAERVVLLHEGKGWDLKERRFTRRDIYSATGIVAAAGGEGSSSSSSSQGTGGGGGESSSYVLLTTEQSSQSHQKGESTAVGVAAAAVGAHSSFHEKVSAFKVAVGKNARLSTALRLRRFDMVTVLESWKLKLAPPSPKEKKVVKRKMSFLAKGSGGGDSGDIELSLSSSSSSSRSSRKTASARSSDVGDKEIGWLELTSRLVRFLGDHYTSDPKSDYQETCLQIFEVWTAHLKKARMAQPEKQQQQKSSGSGSQSSSLSLRFSLLDPGELDYEARVAYHGRQNVLNKLGVTVLLAEILMTLPPGLEGSVQDTAAEFFLELLNGGNLNVQNSLIAFLVEHDVNSSFLGHLGARLDRDHKGLIEAKKRGQTGKAMSGEAKEFAENATQTLRLCQLLCENHNSVFQGLLREQPGKSVQIDLVRKAMTLLTFLVESAKHVTLFSNQENELVAQTLEFLMETALGPCGGNQEHVTHVDVILPLNSIIGAKVGTALYRLKMSANRDDHNEDPNSSSSSSNKSSLSSPLSLLSSGGQGSEESGGVVILGHDLQKLACQLLQACLEGRPNRVTHQEMLRHLELSGLAMLKQELEVDLRELFGATKEQYRLLDDSQGGASELEAAENMQATLAAIVNVGMELGQDLERLQKKSAKSKEALIGGDGVKRGDGNDNDKDDDDDDESSSLHAQLSDRLSKQASRFELSAKHFSWDTDNDDDEQKQKPVKAAAGGDDGGDEDNDKDPLLATIEISWNGKIERQVFPLPLEASCLTDDMKEEFQNGADLSSSEIRMKELLAQAPQFITSMEHVYQVTMTSRLASFLHAHKTNFSKLMYAFVVVLNLNVLMSPQSLSKPLVSAVRHVRDVEELSEGDLFSLGITLVLGAFQFLGYFVILYYAGLMEVPLLVNKFDRTVLENLEAKKETHSLSTFATWGVASAFIVLFCFMHAANFPILISLYAFLLLGICLPWLCVSYRAYLVVPQNGAERLYCLAYETTITAPYFRNCILLQIASVLGFYRKEYFSLMLLDIFNNSATLSDIMRSVTSSGISLGLVFYLFVASCIIYASFGITSFGDQLQVPSADDEDDEDSTCDTTVGCFWFIFYAQLAGSAGDMLGSLATVDNGGGQYIERMIYDSSFFIWVGVVLVNVITGLMVDSFGALREERAEKEETLEGQCFVCGISRNDFDDLDLGADSPPFSAHQEVEHNHWTYVYYVAYLRSKNPTDYTGIETFVFEQIEHKSLDWIPNKTSAAIDAHNKESSATGRGDLHLEGGGGGGGNSADPATGASGDGSGGSGGAASKDEAMVSMLEAFEEQLKQLKEARNEGAVAAGGSGASSSVQAAEQQQQGAARQQQEQSVAAAAAAAALQEQTSSLFREFAAAQEAQTAQVLAQMAELKQQHAAHNEKLNTQLQELDMQVKETREALAMFEDEGFEEGT